MTCDASDAIYHTIPLWYKLFAWFGMFNAVLFILVLAYVYWYYVRKPVDGVEESS